MAAYRLNGHKTTPDPEPVAAPPVDPGLDRCVICGLEMLDSDHHTSPFADGYAHDECIDLANVAAAVVQAESPFTELAATVSTCGERLRDAQVAYNAAYKAMIAHPFWHEMDDLYTGSGD